MTYVYLDESEDLGFGTYGSRWFSSKKMRTTLTCPELSPEPSSVQRDLLATSLTVNPYKIAPTTLMYVSGGVPTSIVMRVDAAHGKTAGGICLIKPEWSENARQFTEKFSEGSQKNYWGISKRRTKMTGLIYGKERMLRRNFRTGFGKLIRALSNMDSQKFQQPKRTLT